MRGRWGHRKSWRDERNIHDTDTVYIYKILQKRWRMIEECIQSDLWPLLVHIEVSKPAYTHGQAHLNTHYNFKSPLLLLKFVMPPTFWCVTPAFLC